ncbi:hypothetical protein J7I93_04815 [Bacillus sp. ISL-47]|uniref:hypothetical protein n=1 Tax=Bacillus sp. ISL-47 TaxID=2819130 RepID=UPI001BE72460|nr:hypothetical protein [Bacillus sp. ISL-47]MBT2687501.1 hypothetical protein [Bacillus sp. ISL-47]MBT2706503.1 hypothetical protein [Pseudomonas sp. ISL-84]
MNSILEEVSEEQKHVLGNLLEFYVYEFTAYLDIELNEEGRYGFKDLDLYIKQ